MSKQKKIGGSLYFTLVLFLQLLCSSTQAQYSLVGDAVKTNLTTYRLTQDSLWENGSIWIEQQISLNNSFDLFFELYFGDNNDGADGITFTLQQQSLNAGSAGQNLGVGGVQPSLIVEYDTYNNTPYDLISDHIAISKNGDLNHTSANNLVKPVHATTDSINIENGQWHNSRVKWDATTKTMEVYFDCVLRLTYTDDVVTNIFSGNPNVYYGFTAATGGSTNEQSVRGFLFDSPAQKIDTAVCIGDTLQLYFSNNDSYHWKSEIGINDTLSSNPLFFPLVNTQYTSSVTRCFTSWSDTVNIIVHNLPVVNLGADQAICNNDPAAVFDAGNGYASYLWSGNGTGTGQTTSGTIPGNYTVTVSTTAGCSASATGVLTLGGNCDTVIKLCFPNVFTPNSDGLNDDFRPCGLQDDEKEKIDASNYTFYSDQLSFMNFVIYDRWGIKMYENYNREIPVWDGFFKSNLASSGTYFWVAHYTNTSNESFEQNGFVTLLKD